MNRLKIAFIVVRYGKEVNGGAEYHCRLLAEKMIKKYDIEIITTCVRNYVTGENFYTPGTEVDNGVVVRRFPVNGTNNLTAEEQRVIHARSKPPRRLRHLLYKLGLLSPLSRFLCTWKWMLDRDIVKQRYSTFYSDDMINYIKENKENYDIFISITAEYAPFYYSAMNIGDKLISIPTLHLCRSSFRGSLAQAFSNTKFVGFNTVSEQKLAKKIFGADLKNNGIISVGIEPAAADDWNRVKRDFNLPDKYILFVGRLERSKIGKMMDYYELYRKKMAGREVLPLVAVGQVFDNSIVSPNVIYTGFVSEAQKRSIIQHAHIIINPSMYESLSLILLEALHDNIPVLVNGKCNVLKEHCIKSRNAVLYYTNKRNFIKNLTRIIYDEDTRKYMAEKGKEYLKDNYDWDIIMKNMENAINFVTESNRVKIGNNEPINHYAFDNCRRFKCFDIS